MEEQTTYEKGRKLENQFSVFMKEQLGWDNVRVGSHAAGKHNSKGTMVDVVGERLDERGKTLGLFGKFYLVGCIVPLVIGLVDCIFDSANDGMGLGLIIGAVILEIIGIVALHFSSKWNKENAWVECKNLKGKVNINQVRKALEEYSDYHRTGSDKYKFVVLYFVSANGFIENAISYAIEHGIVCYEVVDGKFEPVKYFQ